MVEATPGLRKIILRVRKLLDVARPRDGFLTVRSLVRAFRVLVLFEYSVGLFFSGRALATGTVGAGLCLNKYHRTRHTRAMPRLAQASTPLPLRKSVLALLSSLAFGFSGRILIRSGLCCTC